MINAVHRCDWLSSVTGVIYNICDWSVTFLGHYGGCWNRNAPSKHNDSQSFLTYGSGWDGVWVGTWTSEHSISDLGVRGGRPPLSLNKSPTCHITFRSHVCKPTFMSGEGVAGGGMTAADSCQASDRHPRARKTTTRVLTRDIFFSCDRGIQNWTFLTSCRKKQKPKKKKKKNGYFWHDVVTSLRHITGFPETCLANIHTGDLLMWKSLTEGEKNKNAVNGQS